MIEQQATIKNPQGIHCRPSAVIMKAVGEYPGTIRLSSSKGDCDGISILGLMSLGLECGETVNIQVEGEEREQEMCTELATLLETEFDFPQEED